MYEWQQLIQTVVNEMDDAIMRRDDQALTLRALAARLHYSEYHATHKFREIAGMSLRTYLHQRRLAFALKEVRDTDRPLLDIALDYGFSGQEAVSKSATKRFPAPSWRSTALPPVFTAAGPAP